MENLKKFFDKNQKEMSLDDKGLQRIENKVFKKEDRFKSLMANNYFRYGLMIVLLLVIVSIPLDNRNTLLNTGGYSFLSDSTKLDAFYDLKAPQYLGAIANTKPSGQAQVTESKSPQLDQQRMMTAKAKFKYMVTNVWDSLKQLNGLISSTGSFVSENVSNTNGASLLLSVPIEKVEFFQQELRKIGSKIIFEEIKTTDTQNQYNYDTRWITEYKKIIADLEVKLGKETNKEEKVKIQEQINNNKGWLKARESSLEETVNNSKYATLYVEFVQDNDSFKGKLDNMFKERLVTVQGWVINALGWLIYLSVIGIPVWLVVAVVKRFKRN